jgi:hypothetical protein
MIWGRASLINDPSVINVEEGAGIMFTGAVYANTSDNVRAVGAGLGVTIHTDVFPTLPTLAVINTFGTRTLRIDVTGVAGFMLHWYVEVLNLTSPSSSGGV